MLKTPAPLEIMFATSFIGVLVALIGFDFGSKIA